MWTTVFILLVGIWSPQALTSLFQWCWATSIPCSFPRMLSCNGAEHRKLPGCHHNGRRCRKFIFPNPARTRSGPPQWLLGTMTQAPRRQCSAQDITYIPAKYPPIAARVIYWKLRWKAEIHRYTRLKKKVLFKNEYIYAIWLSKTYKIGWTSALRSLPK